jgi:hypothetical protein
MARKQLGVAPSRTDDAATKSYVDTGQYATTIGNGSLTSIPVTHNLGTTDVLVSVHLISSGEEIDCDVFKNNGNTITLGFATAPQSNSIRCVVIAAGAGSSGSGTGGSGVGAGRLIIDFRDCGMIGDGTPRPLSTLFGTLAAAQAVYPAAVALSDELDWAAMQSAVNAHPGDSFLVHSTVHAITNRPLDPTDYSVWTVDGIIENIWPRNTPTAGQDRAAVFHGGNMHPAVLNTGVVWASSTSYSSTQIIQSGSLYYQCVTAGISASSGSGPSGTDTSITDGTVVWKYLRNTNPFTNAFRTYNLSNISKGSNYLTITDLDKPVLSVGDKIIVRSSTGEDNYAGISRIYDFMQFNKVTAYNSVTGNITVELPMGENVGSTSGMTGPTLCVISGTDTNNGQRWRMLDGFELRGRGKVIGRTLFGKQGMWRCRATIQADCEQLVSSNAAIKCYFDISGTFTNRCLEIAFASWESTYIVDGVYRYDPEVASSADATISIGEQSTGNDITVRCFRGPEHVAQVYMMQDQGIRSTIRAQLFDYSSGDANGPISSVVAIKASNFVNRPPADNTYDLYIRTNSQGGGGATAKSSYLTVGAIASESQPAYPRRARWQVNAKSESAPADYLEKIYSGKNNLRGPTIADKVRCFVNGPGIEAPQNATVVLSQVQGPLTVPANTTITLGTYAFGGVGLGDSLDVDLQAVQSPTTQSGSFGDVVATATVVSSAQIRIFLTNYSSTDVVWPSGPILNPHVAWYQRRISLADFIP